MKILGLSSYYHDSAAAIIENGSVVCAFEEERFTRIKHDNGFPEQAINKCLEFSRIAIGDLDAIAYYEKPVLKLERILTTYVETFPFSFKYFLNTIQDALGEKIQVEKTIRKKTGFKGKIFFVPHHTSHAAFSYFLSPYKESAVLTIDGVGEYESTVLWKGSGNKLKKIVSLNFPNSLGLVYSTFTSYLGFKVNNDEYKMMGLSAYGSPIYKEQIFKMINVQGDGNFVVNKKYFSYDRSHKMWTKEFEKLLGKPRVYGGKISKRHKDISASIQQVTEDIYFSVLNKLYDSTLSKNLSLGGGVALNSLANGKIFEKTKFKNVFNPGATVDSGCAIGAALFVYMLTGKNPKRKTLKSLKLGNFYSDEYIETLLKIKEVKFVKFKSDTELSERVSDLLIKDKIVGWFEGRMEFGPRALGSRSIIANPKNREMKNKVNLIKKREPFRPFAASVLENKINFLFEVPKSDTNFSFMNYCLPTKSEKIDLISAVVHKDKTCRVQTVNPTDGLYYKVIKSFYNKTGIPCVLNTSYNVDGEPIVEKPEQALYDFYDNPIDFLVMGRYLITK